NIHLLNTYNVLGEFKTSSTLAQPLTCWDQKGFCRGQCQKKERFYIFCLNGKRCCVKPSYIPKDILEGTLDMKSKT
uniref:Beta-defensin n=1 Tax=Vombatus ursinus TaxID=29139 RepID=A0A4X2K097_VOMUR